MSKLTPTPKRLCLSLKRKRVEHNTNAQEQRRFAPLVTSPQRAVAAKGVVPLKTEASTQWAVRNFNAWSVERSKLSDAQAVPPDILKSHDAELVCLWMCQFVMETRKTDGSRYPPASIRSMVSDCGVRPVNPTFSGTFKNCTINLSL